MASMKPVPAPFQLPFTKMAGTGNDFILFDNRAGFFTGQEKDFFNAICKRRFSIGADGVVLVETGTSAPVRMRYYNSDGQEAAMCGNAARCTALYALDKGIVSGTAFALEASDGVHAVSIDGREVTVQMIRIADFRTGFSILREPEFREGGFINTGVPHFVIFVPDVEKVDARETAPRYRFHPVFPEGANVNFVQLLDSGSIRVRTYERGVEDETLSCGTGCVASALMASGNPGYASPVVVETRGGRLTVAFDPDWKNVFLSGPVEIVYEGVLMQCLRVHDS